MLVSFYDSAMYDDLACFNNYYFLSCLQKDLIASMLHKNPKSRPSAKKIQARLEGSDLSAESPRTI